MIQKTYIYLFITAFLFACTPLDVKRVVIFRDTPEINSIQNTSAQANVLVLDKG